MKIQISSEDKKLCGIYSLLNVINKKRYVGQAIRFSERTYRWNYLSKNPDRVVNNKYLSSSFKKYGHDNFVMEIINVCSKENLDIMERYYIKAFNTLDRRYGYNSESGGNTNKNVSESTKELHRKRMSGNSLHLGFKHHRIHLKPINMLSKDGEILIKFNSFLDAKHYLKLLYGRNTHYNNLSRSIRKNTTEYGFRWSLA